MRAKAFSMLTNQDKAALIWEWFPSQRAKLIEYFKKGSRGIVDQADQIREQMGPNNVVSPDWWIGLAERVLTVASVPKSHTWSTQNYIRRFFDGDMTAMSNQLICNYADSPHASKEFKRAVTLLYDYPVEIEPTHKSKDDSYIILEMHGGPEYATIVTDEDGNNLVFDSLEAAEAESADCQDALIVEI